MNKNLEKKNEKQREYESSPRGIAEKENKEINEKIMLKEYRENREKYLPKKGGRRKSTKKSKKSKKMKKSSKNKKSSKKYST